MAAIPEQDAKPSSGRQPRRTRRGGEKERAERLEAELDRLTSASRALTGKLNELLTEIDGLKAELHELHDAVEAGRSAEPAKSADVGPRGSRGSEAVRLLASQLLAAGSSREEARDRLAKEFGIPDPDKVLDELEARTGA